MKKASAIFAIAAILNLAIFSHIPAHADVIPSRPSQKGRAEKSRVATELAQRGIDPRAAMAQVKEMSARDLDYFSADPKRIQLAAGLLLEEWILAGGFSLWILYILTFIAFED